MSELDDNKFQEICEKIFGVSCYDFENSEIMNFNPMTGAEFSEEQKYLMQMLLKVKELDIGKKLLNELEPNTKINFMIDTSRKDSYGYSNGNHDLAITDPSRSVSENVTTFLHELTHEIQKQQGGNSRLCAVQEDCFIMNKMMEAEARLNTTKAACEIFYGLNSQEEKKAFYSIVDWQTRSDMFLYQKAVVDGKSEEEINRLMLKEFYKDKSWNEDYNEQALDAANYSQSDKIYRQYHGKNTKDMQDDYMRRMGLNKEDAEFFFNPENIAEFPRDKIAKKTIISEEIKGLDVITSQVFENGELVQSEKRDTDGKLISEARYVNNDKVCENKYNKDGTVFSSMFYNKEDNVEITQIYDGKKVQAMVFKQNNEVISIMDKNEQFIDVDGVNKEQSDAIHVFNDIRNGKEVDNALLVATTQAVVKDEYGLYRDMKALQQVLKEAVIEKVENVNLGKSSFENPELESEFKALHAQITKDNPELAGKVRNKLTTVANENVTDTPEVNFSDADISVANPQKETETVVEVKVQETDKVKDIVRNQMKDNLALNETIRNKVAAKINAKLNQDDKETEVVSSVIPEMKEEKSSSVIEPIDKTQFQTQENNDGNIVTGKKENVVDNVKISAITKDEYNPNEVKASEEIILDALLKEGNLTKEQEDKILEAAVQIEQKRLQEQNLETSKNYAEQMVDAVVQDNSLSDKQQNVALDAAVKAESMEMKIARLRGCDKVASSAKKTQQSNTNVKTTNNTMMMQMAALRAQTK